jgi:hypothetical protein
MASTPNLGITLYDNSTPADWVAAFNGHATAIDTGVKSALDAQNVAFDAKVNAATNLIRGTAAQRATTASKYWQLWLDTDGSQKLYVGNKTGGWRQYSGEATAAAGAWDNSSAPAVYARTVSVTLPTVVLSTESIQISSTNTGSGFGAYAMNNITRNPTNTVISIRHYQFLSNAANLLGFTWNVVPL